LPIIGVLIEVNIAGKESKSQWNVIAGIQTVPIFTQSILGLRFTPGSHSCSTHMMNIKQISLYPRVVQPTLYIFGRSWLPFGAGKGVAHFSNQPFDAQNECADPKNVLNFIADPNGWTTFNLVIEYGTNKQQTMLLTVYFDTGHSASYLPKTVYQTIMKSNGPIKLRSSSSPGFINLKQEWGSPLFKPWDRYYGIIGGSILKQLAVGFDKIR
jgi:hypothetical protein